MADTGGAAIRRVGFMTFGPVRGPTRNFQAFVDELRRLGWDDRQGPSRNVMVEYRAEDPTVVPFARVAAELIAWPSDVIVASGTPAISALREATRTIPIVICVDDADPVGIGLVASLERPRGNITGLTRYAPDLSARRLGLLASIVPATTRAGVLWNSTVPGKDLEWAETETAAQQHGWSLTPLPVRAALDLPGAFEAARTARVDALLVLGDPLMYTHRRQVVELAARLAVPALYPVREFVEAGGLASYGAHLPELYLRAATYVDKILRGAQPSTLPMGTPEQYELIVNERTAAGLGLHFDAPWARQVNETIR